MVDDRSLPRYPVYIPSKGRANKCLTAKLLQHDGCPFHLVIEKSEYKQYANVFGEEPLLVLPFENQGLIATRNWIKQHSIDAGFKRHWQIDDNIRVFSRFYRKKRLPVRGGIALRVTEDFVDRYTNVAIAGLNYEMFAVYDMPPFRLNVHVYSCTLILNEIPHKWRLRYNDDTDLCLQVLSDGWCTVLMNAFLADKIHTMKMKGGNTDDLYQGDGRLEMARTLERMWPGVVRIGRRFQRPQHIIFDGWQRFDTKLIRRDDIDFDSMSEDNYGMRLSMTGDEIKHESIRKLYEEQ